MKTLISIGLLTLGLLFSNSSQATDICANQPVPDGYVVTAISTGSCSPYYTYTIAPISNGITMCSVTPIPDGVVVTNISTGGSCSNRYGYTLDTSAIPSRMCSITNVPGGFVVTSVSDDARCEAGAVKYLSYTVALTDTVTSMCSVTAPPADAVITQISVDATCGNFYRYTIDTSGKPTQMCSLTDVPAGYVVTSVSNDARCNLVGASTLFYTLMPVGIASSMCSVTAPPDGAVITQISVDATCGNFYRYTIDQTGSPTQMCSLTDVPAGFVVTSVSNNAACNLVGASTFLYTLEPADTAASMCSVTAPPNGAVITRISVDASCGNFYRYTLDTTGSPTQMCSLTDVPAGFVVTSVSNNAACNLVGASTFLYTLEPANTAASMCSVTSPPTGVVITKISVDSTCGNFYRYTLDTTGTPTQMCSLTNVPAGFVVTSVSNNVACNLVGASTLLYKLAPEDTASSMCSVTSPPAGVVITQISVDATCGNYYRYAIDNSGTPTQMCSLTDVPDGFVVTAVSSDARCNLVGASTYLYTLEPADTASSMCSVTAPPADVVITQINVDASCGNFYRYTIDTSGTPTQMCSLTSVPAGYVVTAVSNAAGCNLVGASTFLYTLALSDTVSSMCSVTAPPAGVVITQISVDASCGNFYRYTIDTTGSPTQMCSLTDVPAGFVVTSVTNAAGCNLVGASTYLYTLEPASTATSMCSVTEIPGGAIVTDVTRGAPCGSLFFTYTMVIDSVPDTMCALTPIPADYLVTAIADDSSDRCDIFLTYTLVNFNDIILPPPVPGSVLWSYQLPDSDWLLSQPVVGIDNKVYMTYNDGTYKNIVAFDPILASPFADNILIPAQPGTTIDPIWTYSFQGPELNRVSQPSIGTEGNIYLTGEDRATNKAVISAIDSALTPTSRIKWDYSYTATTSGDYSNSPVIGSNNTLYTASVVMNTDGTFNSNTTGTPFAVDTNGTLLNINSDMDSPFSVGGTNGNLGSIDQFGNKYFYTSRNWDSTEDQTNCRDSSKFNTLQSRPWPELVSRGICSVTGIAAYDSLDNRKWRLKIRMTGSQSQNVVVGESNVVYWGSGKYGLLAIDANTGNILWQNLDLGAAEVVIGEDDLLYVSVNDFNSDLSQGDSYVAAVNPANGQVVWRRDFNSVLSVPILSQDGSLIVLETYANTLYAVHTESGGMSKTSPWPARNRDAQYSRNANIPVSTLLPRPPPQDSNIAITSPQGPIVFSADTDITLVASATDTYFGDISANIIWQSNIDGVLGNGASITTRLSLAEHTITASLLDTYGNFISATILAEPDSDGDGVADGVDAFPDDPLETMDTDSDGIGNNADPDDDNDGVEDTLDAFPLDSTESIDTDGDGIGNNADPDDDDDGVNDDQDFFPLDPTRYYLDGDINGDLVVDVTDLFMAKRYLTGDITLLPDQVIRGDIYPPGGGDGDITISDVLLLKNSIIQQ